MVNIETAGQLSANVRELDDSIGAVICHTFRQTNRFDRGCMAV